MVMHFSKFHTRVHSEMDSCCVFTIAWADFDSKVCPPRSYCHQKSGYATAILNILQGGTDCLYLIWSLAPFATVPSLYAGFLKGVLLWGSWQLSGGTTPRCWQRYPENGLKMHFCCALVLSVVYTHSIHTCTVLMVIKPLHVVLKLCFKY